MGKISFGLSTPKEHLADAENRAANRKGFADALADLTEKAEKIEELSTGLVKIYEHFGVSSERAEELAGNFLRDVTLSAAKDKIRRSVAEISSGLVIPRIPSLDALKSGTKSEIDLAVDSNPEKLWLLAFQKRFEAHPDLHIGIEWATVESSLQKDPGTARKLQALDRNGHEMNAFGEQNNEIIFRTAQSDVTKIAAEHRTIMYDNRAQEDYKEYQVNGNAERLAADLGVEVADRELYEKCRVEKGWLWLKTDLETRNTTGGAFSGAYVGVGKRNAAFRNDSGSFCAALRVKKA